MKRHLTKRTVLIKMPDHVDIDGKDLRLIRNLYWRYEPVVKINRPTPWRNMESSVLQCCHQIWRVLEWGDKNINNLRHADDSIDS